MPAMKGDKVAVTGPDGSGFVFSPADAKRFVKENPGYTIGEASAPDENTSKAVDSSEVENKAVAPPARRTTRG